MSEAYGDLALHNARDSELFHKHLARLNGASALANPSALQNSSYPILREGDGFSNDGKSINVQQVQQLLGVTADGKFGSKTAGAVRSYQTSVGLPPTGVVDDATWTALLGGSSGTGSGGAGASSGPSKRDKTLQTATDVIGLGTQVASAFVKPPKKGGKGGAAAPYIPPVEEGWGWQHYAIGGAVILGIGVGGYFLFKSVSK